MTVETPITDLVEIELKDAYALFTTDDPRAAMAPIVDKVRKIVDAWERPDVATPGGRREIASFARRISSAKAAVERTGKEIAAEAKKVPGKIDATRRYVEAAFEAMRDEVRQTLTEWETKEDIRKNAHAQNLAALAQMVEAGDRDLGDMRRDLATVEAVKLLNENCEEYLEEYRLATERAREFLKGAIVRVEKSNAEAAEIAALRAEKAERERIDRENDIAAEATRNAEERAREEAAERERKLIEEKEAAERRAVEAAANARAELEAQKRAEDAERAKREADVAHKRKINRAAVAALVAAGLDEKGAEVAIALIAKGGVPNVSISY